MSAFPPWWLPGSVVSGAGVPIPTFNETVVRDGKTYWLEWRRGRATEVYEVTGDDTQELRGYVRVSDPDGSLKDVKAEAVALFMAYKEEW